MTAGQATGTTGSAAAVPTVALIGTLDTKGAEYAFVQQCIEARGHRTLLIDIGVLGPPAVTPDVPRAAVAAAGGASIEALVAKQDRGEAVAAMVTALERM